MSSIIRGAIKEDRTALITLFDTYKQSVFYMSQAILRNESSISVSELVKTSQTVQNMFFVVDTEKTGCLRGLLNHGKRIAKAQKLTYRLTHLGF